MAKSPSKKRKQPVLRANLSSVQSDAKTLPSPKLGTLIDSPLYDLLRVFERAQDQWAARYIVLMSVALLKSAVGLGLFSGKGEKPINGDFEAQRHWMEITTHLPIKHWYYFDLQYWGLDYPPLTAYHLWLCGTIGNWINADWFALGSSRGLESALLVTFMRTVCLLSEAFVYVPAVMQLTTLLGGRKENMSRMYQVIAFTLILCNPSLVLIDNGHFQFNSVMLGLFLQSMIELIKGNLAIASVWFMSSVLFKQMALYYSPFIFFFILSKLFTPRKLLIATLTTFQLGKCIRVGLTVLITATVVFLPFFVVATSVQEAISLINQVLLRMFPFNRGLFEDKVGNFWCTTNVAVKYASRFTNKQLQNMSLVATLLAALPPCLMCFWKNVTQKSTSPTLIVYGFSATAWAFYLFLFQVHEKTVLVPLIPSTFLFLSQTTDIMPIIQWINNVSVFSMYPLLKRDGLALQYFCVTLLNNWLVNGLNLRFSNKAIWPSSSSILFKIIIASSYACILAWHFVDAMFPAPVDLPDLWVLANTTLSFGCFLWFYLWLLYQISVS